MSLYIRALYGDGSNISKVFKRNINNDNIGESWEISAHPNGLSIIKNGEFAGESLFELFNDKTKRSSVFGIQSEELEKFPILAKFIDANKRLSIQVHPNNEYAIKYEKDSGKNEVWYIMDCKENAKIVYGFKSNVTKENLKNAVENIEENVNYINVHKGDFISIPSGTIHAIMEGILICEVQQSSDITYRVYDWNRIDKNGKPRELHKKKALDVIDLYSKNQINNYDNIKENINVYRSDIFNIDMIKVDGNIDNISNRQSFFTYIVIDGKGELKSTDFSETIEKGDTFLVPAALGKYSISGKLKLMKIWI